MEKSPDAFRTISEVAENLDVPQHVLRFWETRFAQIKPMKRSGGRRYYRREDVQLLRGIRHLLYGEGYTIRGVQRILREQGVKAVQNWDAGAVEGHGTAEIADEREDALEAVPANGHAKVEAFDAEEDDAVDDAGGEVVHISREDVTVRTSAKPEVIIVNRISAENIALLRGALNELIECRKLLDRAVGS